MKIAVIDCGTNTFTLSLFEIDASGNFKRSLKERHYVELAAEGIHRIGPLAFQRGIDAFRSFRLFLQDHPKAQTVALGTAALRRASNQQAFVQTVKEVSSIDIQIIDGDQEAALIYQGVRLAAPLGKKPSLIIDIGGGSVEFIIADQQQLLWAKSYPIGVAVLFEKFHQTDPISTKHIQQLREHLSVALADFLSILDNYAIEHLIGASGSFDVLDRMVGSKEEGALFGYIDAQDFANIRDQLVKSSFEERLKMEKLSPTRAKLIVISLLLTDFIHQKIKSPRLVVSNHAMREGLVYKLLNT